MSSGCPGDRLRLRAFLDPQLGRRSMAHLKDAVRDGRRGDDFEIVLGPEVADFQFAQADDGQRRRLDPTNSDHAANARRQQGLRRGPSEGEIEDLVRLLAGHRRFVERTHLRVRFQPGEGLLKRLRILRGEQGPPHPSAIAEMIEDLLTDQLTLAVAIGRQDDVVTGLERRGDGLEFRRLVSAGSGARGIEPFRLEDDARPALPSGMDLLGLGQTKKMALGRQDLSEPRAKGGPEILRLAGLFRNDQRRHGSRRIGWRPQLSPLTGTNKEQIGLRQSGQSLPAKMRACICVALKSGRSVAPRSSTAGRRSAWPAACWPRERSARRPWRPTRLHGG